MQPLENGLHRIVVILAPEGEQTLYYPFAKDAMTVVYCKKSDYATAEVLKEGKDGKSGLDSKVTIVVDSRLAYIAMALHINYPGYPLIYDVINHRLLDIWQWAGDGTLFIYDVSGERYMYLAMTVKHFCPYLAWNESKAKELSTHDHNLLQLLMEYVGNRNYIKNDETEALALTIIDTVRNGFRELISFGKDSNELYSALTIISCFSDEQLKSFP